MRRSLGHGVGLRATHFDAWRSGAVNVDWTECITENFLSLGGGPAAVLRSVREQMPVVLHGVSLSIGSTDPLDERYLEAVRLLIDEVEPAWVSDHLSWSSVDGQHLHELLPLPYTEEALVHVARRVDEVQERWQRPLVLENPSSNLSYAESVMPEWQFLTELARRTGCGVLLDVNNVYVSAVNHGFSAEAYIDAVPADAIWQVHLAGHSNVSGHLIDTHDGPTSAAVLALYRRLVARCGALSTLVEWDESIPSVEALVAESMTARAVECETLKAVA